MQLHVQVQSSYFVSTMSMEKLVQTPNRININNTSIIYTT